MSLPQISQQTRQTLKRLGFVNRLYEDFKISEWNKPRTVAHNVYTYGTMTAAGIGYLIAKRGGYATTALGLAFFAAPIFALFQKRQLDYYEGTSNAIIHPKQLAEEFPLLHQQYNKVLNEVEEEIANQKEILRSLEHGK